MKPNLLVGAYAAYATLVSKSRQTEERFWSGLKELEGVRGIELPLFIAHDEDPLRLSLLNKDWDYVLTLLPGTMQSLQRDPHYGLASVNDSGRQAALSFTDRARRWISSINEHCGRRAVIAVELHSAPTQRVPSDKHRFKAALTRVLTSDWSGAQVLLEHCDAWQGEDLSVKGFMTLEDEIEVVEALPPLRIGLNWGRSVLEGRSVDRALAQLESLIKADCLGAYFFSGVCADDPLYGQWQDNHAPLRTGEAVIWEAQRGLLGPQEVQRIAARLPRNSEFPLGIKVQPAPSELTVEERLLFLDQQIRAFRLALALTE